MHSGLKRIHFNIHFNIHPYFWKSEFILIYSRLLEEGLRIIAVFSFITNALAIINENTAITRFLVFFCNEMNLNWLFKKKKAQLNISPHASQTHWKFSVIENGLKWIEMDSNFQKYANIKINPFQSEMHFYSFIKIAWSIFLSI